MSAAAPPLLMPFMDVLPAMRGAPVTTGGRVALIGRIEAGQGMTLGEGVLIRADGHFVRIGDNFWLGDYGTVHISHDLYPTVIGDTVTVGANAVIHACTVGSGSVIGDDVVILDGSVVGEGVVVEAGSVAFPRSQLVRGGYYAGKPAKRVRDLLPGEAQGFADAIRNRPPAARRSAGRWELTDDILFVARTARLSGAVGGGAGSSVWFSCDLDAGSSHILIGANTNVQDNTVIRAIGAPVTIGGGSVIGHNVSLTDCTIGSGSLIGIGSSVAAGTVVEDGVLLAAGARTAEGQVLESGWVWGHSPARKLAPLDDKNLQLIVRTVDTYRGYAATFRATQSAMGDGQAA